MSWGATVLLPVVLAVVLGMFTVALLLALVRLVIGPSLPDRVVAFDSIALQVVGLVGTIAVSESEPMFLDAAIVLALISFLGTIALARYVERSVTR